MAYAPHVVALQTPVGTIIVSGDDDYISSIRICADNEDPVLPSAPPGSPVMQAAAQLRRYFDGELRAFHLPLVPLTSARGQALRAAIASVPYGETLSYGALARMHDSGARAVGGACANNPYPIVIPCHRITSSGGAKEQYSGGRGPVTKAWLTAHEAQHSKKALL
jgi:methylated-DNA-[protein]-cysteine S-methyltransferase